MDTIYTTRGEAIYQEIIALIESAGTDVANREQFNIEAIADEVIEPVPHGFRLRPDLTEDEFWNTVEQHSF